MLISKPLKNWINSELTHPIHIAKKESRETQADDKPSFRELFPPWKFITELFFFIIIVEHRFVDGAIKLHRIRSFDRYVVWVGLDIGPKPPISSSAGMSSSGNLENEASILWKNCEMKT